MDNRCPVAFSDTTAFKAGTFAQYNNDVCNFENFNIDTNENSVRKGLCALAVTKHPRTHLPPFETCHRIEPFAHGWPFGSYGWNETGVIGSISQQPCPAGQTGNATWECGLDSNWIGYPDMTNCRKIDTQPALSALDGPDSVPFEVLDNLYAEVSREEVIAAGDVIGVVQVVQKAVKVIKSLSLKFV